MRARPGGHGVQRVPIRRHPSVGDQYIPSRRRESSPVNQANRADESLRGGSRPIPRSNEDHRRGSGIGGRCGMPETNSRRVALNRHVAEASRHAAAQRHCISLRQLRALPRHVRLSSHQSAASPIGTPCSRSYASAKSDSLESVFVDRDLKPRRVASANVEYGTPDRRAASTMPTRFTTRRMASSDVFIEDIARYYGIPYVDASVDT